MSNEENKRIIEELQKKSADIPAMQPRKPLQEAAEIPALQPKKGGNDSGNNPKSDK